jgi:hypothetical protein
MVRGLAAGKVGGESASDFPNAGFGTVLLKVLVS